MPLAERCFSFNVNSYDFLNPKTAALYRPQFFRVSLTALQPFNEASGENENGRHPRGQSSPTAHL